MNLSDGRVFCGRRYFDGSGGNNHALLHFQQTGHPLAVKLGTITPDGAGDGNTIQILGHLKQHNSVLFTKCFLLVPTFQQSQNPY